MRDEFCEKLRKLQLISIEIYALHIVKLHSKLINLM